MSWNVNYRVASKACVPARPAYVAGMSTRQTMIRRRAVLAAALLATALPGFANAQERFITLASTTSTEQSGLFGHIIPIFRRDTGIDVRVVAVGTGQALAIGARGDAD